ncbi:MAG: hypothetical protein U0X58_00820 [Flavobacteriaceae bacterium]
MNEAHWHLAVNHLPIILPIAGLIVLILQFDFKSMRLEKQLIFYLLCSNFSRYVNVNW